MANLHLRSAVIKDLATLLQSKISGAINQKHFVLESNHFIQEDQPEKLSSILFGFFRNK